MTPTQYRGGGVNEEILFAVGQSSLGAILVASSKRGVASILIGEDEHARRGPAGQVSKGGASRSADESTCRSAWHPPRLAARRPRHRLPAEGMVCCREIPVGQTVSYGDIARKIGRAEGRSRGCRGMRRQQHCGRHSVPSRSAERWQSIRRRVGRRTQACSDRP